MHATPDNVASQAFCLPELVPLSGWELHCFHLKSSQSELISGNYTVSCTSQAFQSWAQGRILSK